MALTLVEAAKYSNDILQVGVIELFVKDDPVLQRLPFMDIVGNGLTYNVETTLSGAQYYNVGDPWVESTSTVTQTTAVTRILGGDADVDNFLKTTRSNLQDLMQEQIDAKTKAIRRVFLESMIYGYNTGNSKEFDGLHFLIRSSTSGQNNTIAVATASGTSLLLSMERVEAAIDLSRGDGLPDLVLMSKMMRRSINKYLRGVGGISKMESEGKTVQTINDVPIAVTDWIRDNESADLQYGTNESGTAVYGHNYADADGTDDDGGTTIFVLRFGPKQFTGLQSGGMIQVEPLGALEGKDAERTRIKWYPSVMLQQIISCTKVTGVDADGTVAV